MFHAEPTLEPTVPRPTESAYEQKVVVTRPTTLTDTITTSLSLPMEPKSSPIPQPADTSSPPLMSKTLAWNLLTQNQFGAAPITIQRKFQVPKQPPSPPCLPTPLSPPSRRPSPQPPQNPNPIRGDEESLQGKEPFVFNRNRQTTDHFLHELRLYQFVLRPSTRRSRCRISVNRAFVEDKDTQRSSLLSRLTRAEPRRQAWL